jgi:hypothetical protein
MITTYLKRNSNESGKRQSNLHRVLHDGISNYF